MRYMPAIPLSFRQAFDRSALVIALGATALIIGICAATAERIAYERSGAVADVADREYFRFHRDHRGGLRIDKPLLGRLSGRRTILMTLRIDKPDGSFGGVAGVGVDPAYFVSFFQRVSLPPRSLIQLVHTDGI